MSILASPKAMTRAEIAEAREIIAKVRVSLGGLPHRDAVPALTELNALQETICDALPGGFFDSCDGCGSPLGSDDDSRMSEDGDVVCRDCIDQMEKERVA